MSGIEKISDFLRWLGEVEVSLSTAKPPAKALGVQDNAPVLLQRIGSSYEVDRPAKPGDAAPIYLSADKALTTTIRVKPEAAVYGASAARLEAAKASPFPLEEGAFAVEPAPEAWTETGAEWRLTAAPKQRLDEIIATLVAAGTRPGPAFSVASSRAVMLRKSPSSRAVLISGVCVILAAVGATVSVNFGAMQIEQAARQRLAEARNALETAEIEAASALARREEAASPLRQAQIVGAALNRTPSVGTRLAALSAATPDNAFVKRLSIKPEIITGEFVSPDAAALAVKIGTDAAFSSARLKGSARSEAETQQRATLDILPGPGG